MDGGAPAPHRATGTSFVGGSNMAVLSDADSKGSRVGLHRYLSQPEVQVTWYDTVSDLPSVQSAWDDEALSGDELLSAFGDQLADAKAPPAIATWEEVAAEIDTVIEQVTVGDMAAEEGCTAMQEAASSVGTEVGPVQSSAKAVGVRRSASTAGRSPRQDALVGWSFALPFLLLFLVFMAGPILVALVTSFTDLRVTDIRNPLSVEFIGIENYIEVLGDERFQKAAANTAAYVLVGVPLAIALGLGAAVGSQPGNRQIPHVLPGRLLPAGRHQHRRHRGRLANPARHRDRPHQRDPVDLRRRRTGMAQR